MVDYKEVGRRIRYYRQKRNITQEQLAFDIDSSAAYLSNIERAIKKPSLQKLIQISEALEISIDNLVSPKSYHHDKRTEDLDDILHLFSESDRKRLVDSLFYIITGISTESAAAITFTDKVTIAGLESMRMYS